MRPIPFPCCNEAAAVQAEAQDLPAAAEDHHGEVEVQVAAGLVRSGDFTSLRKTNHQTLHESF